MDVCPCGLFLIWPAFSKFWSESIGAGETPSGFFQLFFRIQHHTKPKKESVALGFFMVYAKEDRKRGKQVGTGNLCVYRTSSRAFSLWPSRRASGLCPLKKCHWKNDCGPGRAGCDYVYQRDGAGSGSVGSAGSIAAKRGKSGKIFYGCNNYPKCDFATWDKPTGELCPECKSPLVESKDKVKCSKCKYER